MKKQSVTGNEDICTRFLFQWIKKNIPYDIIKLQKVAEKRYNIILKRGNPRITLTSHIDTVPGSPKIAVTRNNIHGRGSCDAKGQIVVQLMALKNAIKEGLDNYGCFYVVGEEVDSVGARHVRDDKDIGSEYLLNGEPTGNKFVKKSAGILNVKLSTRGKRQHTSIVGFQSAIHHLLSDINAIKNSSFESAMNVGIIQGGEALNVSAYEAMAHLSIRIEQDADMVLRKIHTLCRYADIVILDPPINPFRFYVPFGKKNEAIRVKFSSDSMWYAGKFKKIMMYGPGDISMAHADNEHVALKDLTEAIDTISEILLTYNNHGN